MESSAGQFQEIATENSMENLLLTSKQNQQALLKAKPPQEQPQKCPRCDSINTKFCYYNNYSLSQPRYFCKSCRRYWTKGGTLRNIPVGGGCRRNKRSTPSKKAQPDQQPQFGHSSNPVFAFDGVQKQSNGQLGFDFDPIFGNQQFGGFGNPNGNGFYGGFGDVERFCGEQMMVPFDHQGDESKMLFGFPYDFEFGRESASWSNVIGGPSSTSWHGVLNSPLM